MRIRLLFTVTFLTLGLCPGILACICGVASTPCEQYASLHGQPTFVGRVVSLARVSDVVDGGDRERLARELSISQKRRCRPGEG